MESHFLSLPRVAALSVTITLASSIAAAQTPVSTSPAAEADLPAHGLMASPADVTRAVGTVVRVTSTDRSARKGTLVSLSASQVVLRTRDGETVMPLAQVWRVDKTSQHVRKGAQIGLLTGLGFGALMVKLSPCVGECPPGMDLLGIAMLGGIGAGVGALIGRGINLEGDALYDAGRSRQPVVRLSPIVTPRRAGAHLSVNW